LSHTQQLIWPGSLKELEIDSTSELLATHVALKKHPAAAAADFVLLLLLVPCR
jgi:hypothetical protein